MCRAIGNILIEDGPSWLTNCLEKKRIDLILLTDMHSLSQLSWLTIMMRIDGIERLPLTLQHSLHELYFNLIKDTVFKKQFFKSFVSNYERFIHAQVEYQYLKYSTQGLYQPLTAER